MKLCKVFVFVCGLYFLSNEYTCIAKEVSVPGDYSTIQLAINDTNNGDSVIVSEGTYFENIDFHGKGITVLSQVGPDFTVIDGMQAGSVVTFTNDEYSTTRLEGFTITNGIGTSNGTIARGGGIYCHKASPLLINNVIANNTSDVGGGLFIRGPYCEPVIYKCNIIENLAYNMGGGMYCEDINSFVHSCQILNNRAAFGGGINLKKTKTTCNPLIENNIFEGNVSTSNGGGISSSNGPIPTIKNNLFVHNEAVYGGAIYIYNGLITGNRIILNTATTNTPTNLGGYGGGIACSGSDPIIIDNTISHNTAMSQGGGILYASYAGVISRNIICNNNASGGNVPQNKKCGGGICFYDSFSSGDTIVSNCIFANNEAKECGGAIYIGDMQSVGSRATIINCTITENNARLGSGVFCEKNAILDMHNSIVYDNYSDEIHYIRKKPVVTYSNIKGGYQGAGNIDSDPLFIDPLNDDFHISYLSPCMDKGNDSVNDIGDRDFEKDPRVNYDQIDMGADEFHRHLYILGEATPSGTIQIKLLGLPGTSPVGLFVGVESLDLPIPSGFGNWYLDSPFYLIQLWNYIPANGLALTHKKVPIAPLEKYYLQAVVGDVLSNLYILDVD